MLQNQRQAFGTLDGACKTCKCIHATKSKTDTLGLWMGLVKLVKFVNTFMLQNQRQKNISTESTLTQISTESAWRFLPKKTTCFFDAFTSEDIDFVESMTFPCQGFFPVEGS